MNFDIKDIFNKFLGKGDKNNKDDYQYEGNMGENKRKQKSILKKFFPSIKIEVLDVSSISFDNGYIKMIIDIIAIIIVILMLNMLRIEYIDRKENKISISNLKHNIELLNNNYSKLQDKAQLISELKTYDNKMKDYSQVLYILENTLLNGIDYTNPEFFINNFDYNKNDTTISIKIQGIKHYKDIKQVAFNLRKYSDIFIAEKFNVNFVKKQKENNSVENYYRINLKLKYININ